MTDYTPTTEEIIRKFATGATWQHQSFSVADAEIRRWLAAHDAEVRASVLAEQGEWEYGEQSRFNPETVWTIDPVEQAAIWADIPQDKRVRRRVVPPTEWEPVEENMPHTEGNER